MICLLPRKMGCGESGRVQITTPHSSRIIICSASTKRSFARSNARPDEFRPIGLIAFRLGSRRGVFVSLAILLQQRKMSLWIISRFRSPPLAAPTPTVVEPPDLGSRIADLIQCTRGPRSVMAVSRDAKITYSYLMALIRSERSNPSIATLESICRACGVPLSELISPSKNNSRKSKKGA